MQITTQEIVSTQLATQPPHMSPNPPRKQPAHCYFVVTKNSKDNKTTRDANKITIATKLKI